MTPKIPSEKHHDHYNKAVIQSVIAINVVKIGLCHLLAQKIHLFKFLKKIELFKRDNERENPVSCKNKSPSHFYYLPSRFY